VLEIAKVPNAFKVIFFNFHPIHIETTSLILDIFCGEYGFLWINDVYLDFLKEALSRYKVEFGYKYRY